MPRRCQLFSPRRAFSRDYLLAALLVALGTAQAAAAGFLDGRPTQAPLIIAQSVNRTHPNWPPQVPVDRRVIPEHARLGLMSPPRNGRVTMDGKIMLLAPGLRIRDHDNRIIQPSSLREDVPVRYTVDQYHHLHRVWLSPFEKVAAPLALPPQKKDE